MRVALAAALDIPIERIVSVRLPGVAFAGQLTPEHQIDLYIVDETAVSRLDTIIECRWRGPETKVDQNDVQGVVGVRNSCRATKALIVTNTAFTEGAVRLASAERVGLTVIRPVGAAATVAVVADRAAMLGDFQAVVQGGHAHVLEVVTRAIPPTEGVRLVVSAAPAGGGPAPAPASAPTYQTTAMRPGPGPGGHQTTSIGGLVGGGGSGGPPLGGRGGGGGRGFGPGGGRHG
ncbi:MAG: restriction endonuclease [Myxococcota bacterium]